MQSIIIPYHKDKKMIRFNIELLIQTIPSDVEIVIVGNNTNESELDISFPYTNVKYYKVKSNLFYPKAINQGVRLSSGDIITLVDPDIYVKKGWYEPLIELIQHDDIGAVGCKLLNPITGRIIDFGIAHTRFNAIHPFMGEKASYPLASSNREVQSICSAVLTTKRSLFERVGGMNNDLPYSYTDIDYCLKLRQLGYKTIACANSEVYHTGGSDKSNSKSYAFNYLNADSKGLFYGNWYGKFVIDYKDCFKKSFQYLIQSNNLCSSGYFLLDLSTVYNREDYYETISSLGFKILDKQVVTIPERDCTTLALHKIVPFHSIETPVPIIYFVDIFLCLSGNDLWFHHRNISADIVIDRHGNMHRLSELRDNLC